MSDQFLAKFPTFISDINPELRCKLCKRVMSNASTTPCGCGFCYNCIVNYLEDNNLCPVGDEKCCIGDIQIHDISLDYDVINKINKLIVKCTNRDCDYQDELVKVVHHLEICDTIKFSCPLSDLNCEFTKMNEDDLNDHMQNNEEKHFRILAKSNEDLKTRLSQLEVEKVHLDNENKELKERISNCDKRIDSLKEDGNNLQQKYRELETRLENLEDRNGKQREQLKFENEMKSKYEEKNKEFQSRLENLELIQRENGEIKRGTLRFSSRMSSSAGESVRIKKDNGIKRTSPYTWIINDVTETMNSSDIIWSPSFYLNANGYKMQAGIRLGCEVSFFGRILRSENDSKLIWPYRKSLNIKLINQSTRKTFKKVEIKFDQNSGSQPRKDENGMQRWDARLTLSNLQNVSVIQNDTIIMSCIIDK